MFPFVIAFLTFIIENCEQNFPKIVIIDCGGTISASRDKNCLLSNEKNRLKNYIEENLVTLCPVEFDSPIPKGPKDSSDMSQGDWMILNESIVNFSKKKEIRGIVVAHGTDTLAYTAAAVSIGVENLIIPVVFVASQFSIFEEYTDGINNLIGAIEAACVCPPEVFVFMNHQLMMGNRIAKSNATDIDSFETPTPAIIAR